MGWNIEVAVFEPALQDDYVAVPDVFAETDETVPFWKASSVEMGSNLCIGEVNGRTVLIDVHCRLTGWSEGLKEASDGRRVYLARVSNADQYLAFENQKKRRPDAPQWADDPALDGEQRAWKFLSEKTGVKCPFGLEDAKYRVYSIE